MVCTLLHAKYPETNRKTHPSVPITTKDTKFQLTQVHKDTTFDINENLDKAAKFSLRLPLPD